MSLFGAAALLLSAVGIYGVFSYAVSQRTREIGIRMALGQDPGSIRNQVLAEGARMTAISTGIGLAASLLLTRSLSRSLFWREGRRSADVRGDGGRADGRGAGRLLRPRAQGDAGQSDCGAENGLGLRPQAR